MRITFKGNGVVWDVAREKNLCKFISVGYIEGVYQIGEYTTDDSRIIELLKDYPTVPADAMEYYWKEKEKKEAEEREAKEKLEREIAENEAERLRIEKEKADKLKAEQKKAAKLKADAKKKAEEKKNAEGVEAVDPKPFEDYTVKELNSFAKNNNIDLGDAKNKADIIVLLRG